LAESITITVYSKEARQDSVAPRRARVLVLLPELSSDNRELPKRVTWPSQ
jgi:hypothetical protein